MEDRSDSDVQIDRRSWVVLIKTNGDTNGNYISKSSALS